MRLVPWIPPLFRDRAAAGRALSEVAAVELDEPVVIGVARPPYLRARGMPVVGNAHTMCAIRLATGDPESGSKRRESSAAASARCR